MEKKFKLQKEKKSGKNKEPETKHKAMMRPHRLAIRCGASSVVGTCVIFLGFEFGLSVSGDKLDQPVAEFGGVVIL